MTQTTTVVICSGGAAELRARRGRREMRAGTTVRVPATVVIPTRNRPSLLAECLRGVMAGDVVPVCVLVIDQSDGADDADRAVTSLGQPSVLRVTDPGRGVARARNLGLALAPTPIVALIDDDIIVSSGWLRALIDGVDPEDAVIRTGQVVAEGREGHAWTPSVSGLTDDRTFDEPPNADVLFSGNMAMTRRALEFVGFFDERFGPGAPLAAAVDNDYGYRALSNGLPIVHVAEASAVHLEWRDDHQLLALRLRYGRGQGAFYAKHSGPTPAYVLRRLRHQLPRNLRRLAWGLLHDRTEARLQAADLIGLFTWCRRLVAEGPTIAMRPQRPIGPDAACDRKSARVHLMTHARRCHLSADARADDPRRSAPGLIAHLTSECREVAFACVRRTAEFPPTDASAPR